MGRDNYLIGLQPFEQKSLEHYLPAGCKPTAKPSRPSVTPNEVAHHLIKLGQAKSDGRWEKGVRRMAAAPKPQ